MQDRVVKPVARRASAKSITLTHARPAAACFFNGGVEPHLSDMLSDPIIAMVMHRDRVSADDVLSMMRTAARAT